jgi:uncharacterized membrane protein (UPF0182 family)
MELLQALRQRWWLVVGIILIVAIALSTRLATFYTDVLWFRSIGFVRVFWTLLTTQFGLGLVAGIFMTALLAGNLLLARRLAPRYRIPTPAEENVERYRALVEPIARPLLLVVAVVVGVLSGLNVAPQWPRYVLWANATQFGRQDPQFGLDLGYFVFVLPFHTLVNSWLFTALVITVLMTLVAHYVFGGIRPQAAGQRLTPQVNVHLSVLLAALVAVRAWGFWLDRYMLSYSERGQVTGLSYTDVNAQLVALQLLTIIAAICVVLFLVNIRFRGWLLPVAGVGILVVAAVVLAGIYPAIVQRLQVDPQELPRERPYIRRNLELTRFGFGIDQVAFEDFPANDQLSDAALAENQATLQSIRLWDPATLQNTYQQLQELRPYYDFRDVDVDRYTLDDKLQEVMLSVREVATSDLPAQARTWQNEALVYTHGFGIVSSAVSTRRRDGQPVFFVKDIPPAGVSELEVENPRIYIGEEPPAYSIVGTTEDELDFPLEEGQPVERFRYEGDDGVFVGSPLRRLAFALRFAEPNILLSGLINNESKVMYNRRVRERVQNVAPYLKLDHDAYPVAVGGRVKWIIDTYTTSDMLPYSERTDLAVATVSEQQQLAPVTTDDGQITFQEQSVQVPGLRGTANYIRNSVKAVVDAYDGTVTLYVVDPDDPIIQAWRKVFPDSFTDRSQASAELQSHFRYPEDMFRVQSTMFETYHIPGPDAFYNKDDAWTIPADAQFQANQPDSSEVRAMRPYYLLMRLPGEASEEFALIQPFSPEQRNNLIGWLAGRSDGDQYGQLKAYRMPPTKTVFGPEQIQARINQDDAVSEQITLWNQSGSRVRYGNLLVIPVEDSLLYAQPLFLRADRSEIPELRRVVLVFGDQVVMEESLQAALTALFGTAAPGVEVPEGADEPVAGDAGGGDAGQPLTPSAGDVSDPAVAAALQRALDAFEAADRALADGDLGEYQAQTRAAEEALREVERMLGGGASSTSDAGAEPSAAATEP